MVTEKELKSQDFTKFTASTKSVAAFWQQLGNALKVHHSTDVLEAIELAMAGRKKDPMEDQLPALASAEYKAWADPQSTDAAVKRRGRVLSHLCDKMTKAMALVKISTTVQSLRSTQMAAARCSTIRARSLSNIR